MLRSFVRQVFPTMEKDMVQVMQWQPLSVYKHRSFGVKHPPFWQIWAFSLRFAMNTRRGDKCNSEYIVRHFSKFFYASIVTGMTRTFRVSTQGATEGASPGRGP